MVNEGVSSRPNIKVRIGVGLGVMFLGFLIFLLGINPGLFGLDRSPILGLIQIIVFLIGLGILCLGGYITLNILWNGTQKTIAADIGLRLISTGYLIAFTASAADFFGFGSQIYPSIPHFGILQTVGVVFGQILIITGLILMIPWPHRSQEIPAGEAQNS
jgi:hypothetical protein